MISTREPTFVLDTRKEILSLSAKLYIQGRNFPELMIGTIISSRERLSD